MNEHPQIKTLEYNHIADGIYIGTNQCCQTHFDEKLKQEGIEADISLEQERVDTPFGVQFYVWIPIKNHTAPTNEQLNFGVATIEKLIDMKKKIYVHCQNGHGRAPTLVAAYFIKRGKSVEEAIDFIKSKRATIHLEKIQKESLVDFSKSVNQSCCAMKDTSKTLAWFFAVITCPCHLFILAVLLAGTAAGAFVKSYFIPLVVIFSILFALSIWKAIKTK